VSGRPVHSSTLVVDSGAPGTVGVTMVVVVAVLPSPSLSPVFGVAMLAVLLPDGDWVRCTTCVDTCCGVVVSVSRSPPVVSVAVFSSCVVGMVAVVAVTIPAFSTVVSIAAVTVLLSIQSASYPSQQSFHR
jgi:hypothetical protein